MRSLIIDKEAKLNIKKLVNYAENNPLSLNHISNVLNKLAPPPGDNPNYVCWIEHGFRCVFTIEQLPLKQEFIESGQPNSIWMRHLSVSVNNTERAPNQTAVKMLMKEFGFKGENFEDLENIWLEEREGLPIAVNIVEEY